MTDSPRSEHWIVIGAGSAGCVLANRLSADPERHVTLLDDGPDLVAGSVPPSIAGPDFLQALDEPGRTHAGLVATRTTGAAPTPYQRGRGIGGSSAVNAMIALRGSARQYAAWGWDDADAAWQLLQLPEAAAEPGELGVVDRALLAASPDAEPAVLTRRDSHRVTSAEAYLWPVRQRSNLTVRPDTAVDRIALAGRRACGVHLADGSTLDADHVVLAAGAIHSPAILLRSGIDTPGIGRGLRDHPAAPLTLHLAAGADARPTGLVSGSLLHRRIGSRLVQLLPMNHLGTAPEAAGLALLMPALMTPVGSAGSVTIDSAGQPVVDFALLRDPTDLAALAAAVHLALDLIARPAFADVVDDVFIDEYGTTADRLRHETTLHAWLRSRAGDYVHASSSCAMGTVVDDDFAVNGYERLSICDASVFPDIPEANTHLPVTMAAERFCLRATLQP